MSPLRPFAAAALACAIILTGCQTGPKPVRTGSPGEIWVEGHFANGLEVDGAFNRDGSLDNSAFLGHYFPGTKVKLTDLRGAQTPSGFLQVQAQVENPTRGRERIQYRFLWFGPDGMEIDRETGGWVSETLEGKEIRTLEGVTRSPGAIRFKLFIRSYTPSK